MRSRERKILRNAAQCLLCNDIVESTFRHDFRYCKCKAMYVDGGKDYIRRGAKSFDDVKDLSEYGEECK